MAKIDFLQMSHFGSVWCFLDDFICWAHGVGYQPSLLDELRVIATAHDTLIDEAGINELCRRMSFNDAVRFNEEILRLKRNYDKKLHRPAR